MQLLVGSEDKVSFARLLVENEGNRWTGITSQYVMQFCTSYSLVIIAAETNP